MFSFPRVANFAFRVDSSQSRKLFVVCFPVFVFLTDGVIQSPMPGLFKHSFAWFCLITTRRQPRPTFTNFIGNGRTRWLTRRVPQSKYNVATTGSLLFVIFCGAATTRGPSGWSSRGRPSGPAAVLVARR